MLKKERLRIETRLVQAGVGRDTLTGAISLPIHPSATYRHPAVGQSTGYDYTRSGNPTREALEELLADMEGGSRGLAFASGMAALTTLFLYFSSGDHLILSEDLYGGTYRVLDQIFLRFQLTTSYVDTSDLNAVNNAITPATKAVLVETPGNPLLGIADIRAIARLCKQHRLLFIVDNTFLTPLLQRPIELGADIVIHSATKYLGGHNDLCAGALVTADKKLGDELYFLQNSTGPILPPQDCWLLVRSLKTLALRLERQCQSAQQIAEWLDLQPQVQTVYFPGLPTHPGHQLIQEQATGFGAMLSFRVDSHQRARQILERIKIISFAESLGGVESLLTLPAIQTHGDIPASERERLGICESLLRLSVGCEDVNDLIADLRQALNG
ncbi:trans-sulfuration enzyme family protein [Geopsychrobacter electrodiphilus]|uniref:trans-sulfuration enzyme family protein n=1 Tax=Geopsychrobacter electrodiphilus TaxID=225196 RepID=UPI0003604E23|nr:PLP-dependent aspartate aminotransferase family protein [Geopsychrobacter electrodiphilus]